MSPGLRAGYLRRLGVTDPGSPSAEGLFALQRAHLERVAYDNVGIQLGRPPGIDPERSARRIAAGGGGYCFHLNGAFALLLGSLGYDVTRHLGGVDADPGSRAVSGDHLALTVRVGGGAYFVDTGLGDGPHEPLPLRAGAYERGRFRYVMERLEPLEGEGPGWTYRNPGGPMPRVNFRDAPAVTADFAAMHTRLSSAAESPFVRNFALLRRDAEGVDVLRGRVLSRIDPARGTSQRELAGPEEFRAAIEGVFGRRLDGLTPEDRAALWAAACRAHEAWQARRAAGT